jgi:hypothetical protein
MGCTVGCCNTCDGNVVLDDRANPRVSLWLDAADLACQGDESQVCCGVDAQGRVVIARGSVYANGTSVSLWGVSLCVP